MNFASLHFWIILIAGYLILSVCLRRFAIGRFPRYDQAALLTLSLTLLLSESLLTLGIFIYVAVTGYLAVKYGAARNTIGVLTCAVLLLVPLAVFKYSGFLASETGLGGTLVWNGIIPMGISFYTFQTLSMVVDKRNDRGGGRFFHKCDELPELLSPDRRRTHREN